jgi:hypothetical protein
MCEICNDTGWYGDKGPGRIGNKEYMQCDCRLQKKENCFEKAYDTYFHEPCDQCKHRFAALDRGPCRACIYYYT